MAFDAAVVLVCPPLLGVITTSQELRQVEGMGYDPRWFRCLAAHGALVEVPLLHPGGPAEGDPLWQVEQTDGVARGVWVLDCPRDAKLCCYSSCRGCLQSEVGAEFDLVMLCCCELVTWQAVDEFC